MRRRTFITLLTGAAVALPFATRAQAVPVIGFLRGSTAAGSELLVAALRQGLSETGYVEGQNVAIEYRWADGHPERLPALAADLVGRQVSVIVGSASTGASAAKAATSTIPIVFVTTVDPVKAGLVESFNRPGGNATGMAYLTSALGAKRLEFLRQLVPSAESVAVLVHADNPATEPLLRDLRVGAAVLGLQIIVSSVNSEDDFEPAFAALAQQRPGALVVGADPLLTSRSAQIAALALRHRLPAIYTTSDWARVGGLMAWGVSLTDQYRWAGIYVGKILKGAKPGDLPVLQPIKYELVINLKTAKALGLEVPPTLLSRADEVIE
ncbi:MAG: ABC transporter substrate-binding protein [Xanthobacteraceae bacterium]